MLRRLSTPPAVQRPAPGPRQRGVGPAREDHVGFAVKAERAIALPQARRAIRAEAEAGRVSGHSAAPSLGGAGGTPSGGFRTTRNPIAFRAPGTKTPIPTRRTGSAGKSARYG